MWMRVFLAGALASVPALAQQSAAAGTLAGHIVDESGGAIASAAVTALNRERNQRWMAVSATDGWFRFLRLPAGSYEVRVQAPKFATSAVNVTLSAGQALEIPVRLNVAGTSTAVLVAETANPVETTRTQQSERVIARRWTDCR